MRQNGYEQAGLRMLDASDLIIVIWDGVPNTRPGCTAQVVEKAKKRGIPIFWIHSVDPTGKIAMLFEQGVSQTSLDSTLMEKINGMR